MYLSNLSRYLLASIGLILSANFRYKSCNIQSSIYLALSNFLISLICVLEESNHNAMVDVVKETLDVAIPFYPTKNYSDLLIAGSSVLAGNRVNSSLTVHHNIAFSIIIYCLLQQFIVCCRHTKRTHFIIFYSV